MDLVGMSGEGRTVVSGPSTAEAMQSGTLPVFATPAMVQLIEGTACGSIAPALPEGSTSVGISLHIRHTAPSVIGSCIVCRTEVIAADGRKVVFRVEVRDGSGEIGSGTHERFIVESGAFMRKAGLRAGKDYIQ